MQPPKQDFSMTLHKVDQDEKLLAVIKRHPFGIIKLYFQVSFALAVAGALIYFVLPQAFPSEDYPTLYNIVGVLAVVVVVFMLAIVAIATVLYNMSQLVITDQTITQTIQVGLFNRKTSQLAVSSVEDVTANKNGFFPTILNYGRLLVETAGEQENFHFDYCPHADHYAKLILETRQQFMGNREHDYFESRQAFSNRSSPTVAAPGQVPTPFNQQAPDGRTMDLGAVATDGSQEQPPR